MKQPVDGLSSTSNPKALSKCTLPSTLRFLESVGCESLYPQGTLLFREGQAAAGIFILHSGRVQLSISDHEGHPVPVRIAEPGEVLGLSATLSSRPHEITAEATTPCCVSFVWREDFLHLLHDQTGAALGVVQWLSHNLNPTLDQIRSLRLQISCRSGLLHALLVTAFSWIASIAS